MEFVPTPHLVRSRELHLSSRWEEACAEYAAADAAEPLAVEDLASYAEAAQVSAHGDEAAALLHRVFDLRVQADELDDAAEVAFWLWWVLVNSNQIVEASGWLQQATRVLGPAAATSPWLRCPEAMMHSTMGDYARAGELLGKVVRDGRGEVVPWALCMWGQALIEEGRLGEGLDRLEEAMSILLRRGLSPRVTPWVYCAGVRGSCMARDFTRARAWSRSMVGWLDSLSSLGGAYLGNCRIYRSRLMCLNGAWTDALEEISEVCDDLDGYAGWICGHAFYQLAEVRRLRGEREAAEAAYLRAAEHGCPTQPGLALLRLADGEIGTASAGIRRALTEAISKVDRLDLLKAAVTIYLEAGQVDAAREAVAEFAEIAGESTTAVIEAETATIRGALAIAEGDPGRALPFLRRAVNAWQEQETPYEVATLNVLIGQACRALDDADGARIEFAAARETFTRLGALQDLARLDAIVSPGDATSRTHGLTPREIEVLRLIAKGRPNRTIAGELHLSERTVHRHVANIFTKLGVDSRTAAVTHAIKHRLIEVGTL